MTHDILHRFIFENEPVRGEYVKLDTSLQTILNQHDYPKAVRQLLSEGLCIAALLSAIIKFKGRLTLQFRGSGKIKLLLAQCTDQSQMRGLVKYDGTITEEELVDSFKNGILMVLLDTGINGQRYQGVVEWKGNSLAESVENYFQQSEQLATKIWLQTNDQNAAGFLLQVIPTTQQDSIGVQNEIILPSWQRIVDMTAKQDMNLILQQPFPELLQELYPEETLRVFDPANVSFHCGCTRKRGQDAIALLGREEAEEELADKQSIVVTCDFCNEEYIFDRVDVEEIFKNQGQSAPPDTHLH